LDEAGFHDCEIVASSSLDEYVIRDLLNQGAQIDSFGVGERLITARSEPVFGGVYKLTAIEKDGEIIPKIKVRENVEKITYPGCNQLYRMYDKDTDADIYDVVTLHYVIIDDTKSYEIFHPLFTWKKKTLTNFYAKQLLVKIFNKGECIYDTPPVNEIRDYCKEQIDTLWEEVKRFENPHEYFVDLSKPLWDIKDQLLKQHE